MDIKLQVPKPAQLRPKITVIGVGGAGSNAVNNMIASGLTGVNFVVANTDAQSLANSAAESRIQLGASLTEGLGAGARPEIGKAAAEETIEEIRSHVAGSHMVFVAAGMGGGTGTGAAAVIARVARESGALAVGVVTKPFHFEGSRRMRSAEAGIVALKPEVDTLLVIPNQNLFRIANERTTFAEAFVLADQVLYSGIACVVDLIVKDGLINLDFADVRTVMSGMGTAMMGTGEASGERRAVLAAEEAISNPLLDDISLHGAKGLLVSITGNRDLTLYEVDEAATRVRQEVDPEANIIVGATFDDLLGDRIRVSIVASGMERLIPIDRPAQAPSAVPSFAGAPAVPDNQPPFIEPYPAPYAPVPLPPGQQPLAPHELPRAAPPDSELMRVLSEALVSRSEPEPTAGQSPAAGWRSPTGAVFADAPTQLGRHLAPQQIAKLEHAPDRAGYGSTFTPQPPVDMRPLSRRMPQVEDFPSIAQREYHAKSPYYAEPPLAPPRAYVQPAAQAQARKLGFLERLMGAKRKAPANAQAPTTYQQVPDRHVATRDEPTSGGRGHPADGSRGSAKEKDEVRDLPTLFSTNRK